MALGATTASPLAIARIAASSSSGSASLSRKPRRAGSQGGEHVLVEVEGREHEDLRLALDQRGRGDAVEARHAHVHQHDVGGRDRQRLDRLAAVGRLADDGHVGLGVDHELEAVADQRLVVGDEDADHDAGIAARTSKPPSGRGPASSVPPRGSTRSRIPVSPRPRPSLGAFPAPSSQTITVTRSGSQRSRTFAGRAGAGVLEHVGQRLLGDAVDAPARRRARAVLDRPPARVRRRALPRGCARRARAARPGRAAARRGAASPSRPSARRISF